MTHDRDLSAYEGTRRQVVDVAQLAARIALGLVLLLGWTETCTAQSDKAERAEEQRSLRAFREAFRASSSGAGLQEARRDAFDELLGSSLEVCVALLGATTQLEEQAVRIEKLRTRSLFNNPAPDITLQRRDVLDPLRELQRHIAWRLIEIDDPGAVEHMVDEALDGKELPFTLRLRLASRAGELHSKLGARLMTRMGSRDVATACIGLTAFLACDERPGRAVPVAIKQLDHRSKLVRKLAANALAELPSPKSVKALVERLKDETGRTLEQMCAALATLTRAKLRPSAAAWEHWWGEHRDEVNSGDFRLGGGDPTADAALRLEAKMRYHGIAVDGEAVMFVLDCSDSMLAPMRVEDGSSADPPTRLARAKARLITSLHALPSDVPFNIVIFGTGARAYAVEMVTATERHVQAASEWVADLEVAGGTALYDGLDLAFQTGGRPAQDEPFELAFDTMFVLMDGLPTRPRSEGAKRMFEKDSFGAILDAIERWNLLSQVEVHAVALGQGFPRELVRELAHRNGGSLVQEF